MGAYVARSLYWGHVHNGPRDRIGEKGGVIRPIGRRNNDKALIKASCFLIFFHLGLNVSLCS